MRTMSSKNGTFISSLLPSLGVLLALMSLAHALFRSGISLFVSANIVMWELSTNYPFSILLLNPADCHHYYDSCLC
jgi:hypothetical protein